MMRGSIFKTKVQKASIKLRRTNIIEHLHRADLLLAKFSRKQRAEAVCKEA